MLFVVLHNLSLHGGVLVGHKAIRGQISMVGIILRNEVAA